MHVHTPESFHHNFRFTNEEDSEKYKNNIWEKYVNELEKISDISVIGITDYFCIEGYKRILKYRQENRVQNFDLILPNVEFRLDKLLSSRKGESARRLNYHVIFSEELDTSKIEKEFLEELHIKTHKGENRKLTRESIIEIGETLKKYQATFEGKSAYVVGCENITVKFDEIISTLKDKESIFGGKYLLVLPEEMWCLMDWGGQDHLTRKELLIRSHAIFSSNPNTREWALGRKNSSPRDFMREFSSLKPCLHGSDAHSFQDLCKPDQDRFCWIKADTFFEGLRQIIYEPEERVRIQAEIPESRKNIHTLKSVNIENSCITNELSIEEQNIPLNRNLTVVTGGKGSGKTALLDMIANCFEDRCRRSGEDRNSFVQRIEDQRPDLKIHIDFIGENVEGFSKGIAEENFFYGSRITYLPQGKIEEYSGDRQKLDEKIEEIIFSNKEVKEGDYKQKFDKLRDEIDQISKKISKSNEEMFEFEEKTKENIFSNKERQKEVKQGELKNKEDELQELRESVEEELSEKVEELKDEEESLRTKHSKLEDANANIEEFKKRLEILLEENNKKIDNLNDELSELSVDIRIPSLNFHFQLNESQKILDIIPQRITEIKKEIQEKVSKVSQFSETEKAQANLIEEIKNIKKDIGNLEDELKNLERCKEGIKNLESERKENHQSRLGKYLEWKNHYDEVIITFSKGKSEIMGDIDFESTIYFDKDKFIELGLEIVDLRSINQNEIEECAEMLEIALSENTYNKLEESLEKFFQRVYKVRRHLKKTKTNYDFYKWVFDDYFSLSTKISFRGTLLEKLSIGQKGTVLLKLFLAEGDCPLIVDQPEENLDNKFIYDELVGAFREAKKVRQILIATNNANLVVNTDSEQIIVAKYENNKIIYESGTLENSHLLEDIKPILEGGDEAFKKRGERYGIQTSW